MGRTKKILIGVGAIFGVVILILVGIMALAPETFEESIPHERTITIASGVYVVEPGTTKKFSFQVPSGASDIRIKIDFEAEGGSNDDIIVKIIDEDGHIVYNSGKVTSVHHTVNLWESGVYYLVLDNTFSLVSSKSVDIYAEVIYVK